MVVVGLTVLLPGVATPPMPLSITASCALLTNPQLNVVDCPAVIVVGEMLKEAMFGVPEQPSAAVGAGAGTADVTLILTKTVTPNGVLSGLCSRQKPVASPDVAGAVIGTSKSAVAPGAVLGTPISGVAPMRSPLTNANLYPSPHSQVPVLRTRQILLNV